MGLAGVAYDGSIWVTAASSVGLVLGSGGLVMAGAALIARRVASGDMQLPGDVASGTAPRQRQARRVQPLQKSSSSQQSGVQPPPPADSVDEVQ